jgi:hypothetical protein
LAALPRIDRDATKAEGLDDGVLNASSSYYLAASEILRQFLKKWKYLITIFSVEDFLHPRLLVLHLDSFRLKERTNRANHIQVENSR